jgi:amidohydrolase
MREATTGFDTVLQHWTPTLAGHLAEMYRDLHRHPELSLREHRTAAEVVRAIDHLDLDVTAGVGGTGVVAVLRQGDGPVVMLRADMDALPVAEATGLSYASSARSTDANDREVPVAHACGHDMHVVSLIGALHLLAGGRESWCGTVVAVFQPAEELARGAKDMIADGLFERFPSPRIVLGQHVGPTPAGTIGYASGPAMAGVDSVQVSLFGRGGHAGWPEQTVDPVVMAAAAVMRLQTVVAREIASNEQAVLTVGRLHAGSTENVIPHTAELGITIRTYSPATRDHLRGAVERVLRAESEASAAPRPPHFEWGVSSPALVNDSEATAQTMGIFEEHFGATNVVEYPRIAASEDVGAFGAELAVPTVYWFLGGTDPQVFANAMESGASLPFNHSPEFAPAIEPTLTTGVKALTLAALTWLSS